MTDSLPIRDSYLTDPIQYVRPYWPEAIAENLTPELLAMLMRDSKDGDSAAYLTLAEEMEEREVDYAAALQTRKQAVRCLSPLIKAVKSPNAMHRAHVGAVEQLVDDDVFGDLIAGLLDAIGKGYAAMEIIWERDGDFWQPVGYEWRDPRLFVLCGSDLRLRCESNGSRSVPLPAGRFVVHFSRRKMGNPITSGLARPMAAAYMCKSYSLMGWMRFMEVYGIPLRIGRYGAGASKNDLEILHRAVVGLGSDVAAILPDSMHIEFADAATSVDASLFSAPAHHWSRKITMAVLGQTLTSDAGRGAATVHDQIRKSLVRHDADGLARTIGVQLIRPFIDLNFGPQPHGGYPKVSFPVPEPRANAEFAEAISTLVGVGLKVPEKWMRARVGWPEPKPGEEVLGPRT